MNARLFGVSKQTPRASPNRADKANLTLCMAHKSSVVIFNPSTGMGAFDIGNKEIIESAKITTEKKREDTQNRNLFSSEDEALAYLADVLVEAYFNQRKHDSNNPTN